MITSLQILNKTLNTKNYDLIERNNLTVDFFPDYEKEYNFIKDHYEKYDNVPDKETFIDNFSEWVFTQTEENDNYLIDKIREEKLYSSTAKLLNESAKMLVVDSNDAVDHLLTNLETINPTYMSDGVDIIKNADKRLKEHQRRKSMGNKWFIPSGFPELDRSIGGWQQGEEFVLIFARTSVGKSQILVKTMTTAWQLGKNVGYISPEMGDDSIGFRFDTMNKNFSNRDLSRGKDTKGYEDYINGLKDAQNSIHVANKRDFGGHITISKIVRWAKRLKLDMICIDGVTYLEDERSSRHDSKRDQLTHISEDIMQASVDLGIPIIGVQQSNRDDKEDFNKADILVTIRDSDGIAHNCTKIIHLKQCGPAIELYVAKNRNGEDQVKVLYKWDIDHGIFVHIPGSITDNDSVQVESTEILEENDLTSIF